MSGRGVARFFGHPGSPVNYFSAGPVESLPRFSISGLAVLGVPLGTMFNPCAFAFAVESAVAFAVYEPFGWLGFVSIYVVCFKCGAVKVLVRGTEHWFAAVFAFGAVDEVE